MKYVREDFGKCFDLFICRSNQICRDVSTMSPASFVRESDYFASYSNHQYNIVGMKKVNVVSGIIKNAVYLEGAI